ncbi:MAG: glycosyltransferase family 9 protein [Candidatus Omnitrophica bacterium]|nr:glycosyltransferase family 9 protein [Candidatus Omnitrophota bacterium]
MKVFKRHMTAKLINNGEKIKSILFVTLSNLGDIILSTPVLEALSRKYPSAGIDVICGQAGAEMLKKHHAVREITVSTRKKVLQRIEQLAELRQKAYDIVVDLKNPLLPAFTGRRRFRYLLNLACSYFRRTKVGKVLNGRVVGGEHKVNEHLSKLALCGIDASDPEFFCLVDENDEILAENILQNVKGRKMIILNPGAKSHLKRWSAAKFAELAKKLKEKINAAIIVVGAAEDRLIVDEILSFAKTDLVDMCGKTSVGELMALMSKADLVVTNDSAPLHMASVVNAPTVAVFGPTDERKYGPVSGRHKVIKPAVLCRPCGKALCKIKGKDEGCINDVTVAEVFSASLALLGGI